MIMNLAPGAPLLDRAVDISKAAELSRDYPPEIGKAFFAEHPGHLNPSSMENKVNPPVALKDLFDQSFSSAAVAQIRGVVLVCAVQRPETLLRSHHFVGRL